MHRVCADFRNHLFRSSDCGTPGAHPRFAGQVDRPDRRRHLRPCLHRQHTEVDVAQQHRQRTRRVTLHDRSGLKERHVRRGHRHPKNEEANRNGSKNRAGCPGVGWWSRLGTTPGVGARRDPPS